MIVTHKLAGTKGLGTIRMTKTYKQPNHDFSGLLRGHNYLDTMCSVEGGSLPMGKTRKVKVDACILDMLKKDKASKKTKNDKYDEHDKKIADFSKKIQENPNNAEALYGRGLAYFGKGNCERAWAYVREEYNKAIADYKLAALDFTVAIGIYKQKMKENPDDAVVKEACAKVLNSRAEAHEKIGKTDLAKKDREEANEIMAHK